MTPITQKSSNDYCIDGESLIESDHENNDPEIIKHEINKIRESFLRDMALNQNINGDSLTNNERNIKIKRKQARVYNCYNKNKINGINSLSELKNKSDKIEQKRQELEENFKKLQSQIQKNCKNNTKKMINKKERISNNTQKITNNSRYQLKIPKNVFIQKKSQQIKKHSFPIIELIYVYGYYSELMIVNQAN